ncbi:MAG TPA: acyl-CoA carboxylase subunit beta [Caldilineae bacterium]|nr:acyl-CoA carboxylase subunit beta [Caldilineae bacterium]
MTDPLTELQQRRERAMQGGGEARVKQQHRHGKLTARERLALLLDEGTFQELGLLVTHRIHDFDMDRKRFAGDGVVTGYGKIKGRRVAVYAQDFTVLGGSFAEMHANKIVQVQKLALENGIPLIGLLDSGGARIQEGVRGLAGYGKMFTQNVLASGVIPQLSVMMGPCAGGSVYSPALTDFVIMVNDTSFMFLTGPEVIRTVTGEDVSFQDLGGAATHNAVSGVAHFAADNEQEALALVQRLLTYLPQNNLETPQRMPVGDPPERREVALNTLVPADENTPYNIKDVIRLVFDPGSFLEVQAAYAANAVVGFARLDGYTVGVVANQPNYLAGVLDIDSSDKIAGFIRFCDAFNIPVLTFVDTPGFMPGVHQEHGGVIRHGAKIIFAYSEATVPKISIVLRKAMGGAYIAMSSKEMRSDFAFAWPTAQIAVMGVDGAVQILYHRQLAQAENREEAERAFAEEYRKKFYNPYVVASIGLIDEVIEPQETRIKLVRALEVLRSKVQQNPSKKHGLVPL